jgi:hypothetical protein
MEAVDRVNRRDVIKLGAVGAAIAGLGVRGARPAAAAAGTTKGVHIHATLLVIRDGPGAPPGSGTAIEVPPGADVRFNINIDVWGPDSDISGFGWGALADRDDPSQPARVDATQRLFSQRGSIVGDVVKLKGRMLFSYVPGDVGGPIVTEANLATGHIRFYASNSASTGFLEGTGVVMRI